MQFVRRLWKTIAGLLDSLEAVAALGSLILVVGLLASGRVPRDVELLAYALLGALLITAIVFGLFVWRKSAGR